MKRKDFLTDYCLSILLKIAGPLFRALPLRLGFCIARRLGDLAYCLDGRHRCRVYANIKQAIGSSHGPAELRYHTRGFFRAYAQNIVELFYTPLINGEYLKKYVRIQGFEHVQEAFRRGRGVIFAAVHAGGGEISNAVCAHLGFDYYQFVRTQKLPRMENILASYRKAHGSRFIRREKQLRDLLEALKANASVAMTVDQGGRKGELMEFFGRRASMASGAVRIALKSGCALVPVFVRRVRGPHIEFAVEPACELSRSNDFEQDVRAGLARLIGIFEPHIRRFPYEYFWMYKIWKYSDQATVLILSDGKTGHLRQSQALAQVTRAYLQDKGIEVQTATQEIVFRSPFSSRALIAAACLSGRYACQGCLWCLRSTLDPQALSRLRGLKPDIVISCGSSLVAVNLLLAAENQARSCVIMRPSIFSARRFDLVVEPHHDLPRRRGNVAVTDGALNLIDEPYLAGQAGQLRAACGLPEGEPGMGVGVLIGGDTRDFKLAAEDVAELLRQVDAFCRRHSAGIMATTSRRTPPAVEETVREQLQNSPRQKVLVIANEKNLSSAVGGILGLSRMVVVTPESISMISEAAASRAYVFVMESAGLGRRHRRFLDHLARNHFIFPVKPGRLTEAMEKVFSEQPEKKALADRDIVRKALERVL